jgi:hypothetical protein
VTVQVFDDGVPSLSVTQSFNITVNEVNTAPSLAPIPDYTVRRNRLLTFTNAAADLDLPAQVLTYSLDGTPPSGATVSASTGVFSWTPNATQAPSTNTLSVRVTDAGTPALSAVQAFVVTVTAPVPPAIHLTDNGDGSVTLEWETVIGETYQMEFSDNLGTASWPALGGPVTGTGQSRSIINSPSGQQRFYRLRLLD